MIRIAFLLAVSLVMLACKSEQGGKAAMPPATGEKAPERPTLPSLPTADEAKKTVTPETSDKTTGTTYPIEHAEVAPEMSGIIANLEVEEGDKVKKGQLLFRLRTADLGLRVQQAEAQLESAKVRLSAVKTEHDRTQRLFEQKAVDQARWDAIQAEYRGAQVEVEQAKVAVSLARQALSDTAVRSPIDGIVTKKLKNPGEAVSMMPPTVVLIVEDHSRLELRFKMPERALSRVAVGSPVKAHFAAIAATRDAQVTRISPNIDPATRTVEIVANLDNPDAALRAGMLAEVDLGEGRK